MVGKLFPKTPQMPEPPKPTRMPVETDPDVIAAGMRTREAALKRKGRLSTILTDTLKDVGGADTYSRTTIG